VTCPEETGSTGRSVGIRWVTDRPVSSASQASLARPNCLMEWYCATAHSGPPRRR